MSRQKQQTRKYEKRRRAESEAATRMRITEAAVDLHGSLGPAKTTMSAVAERAGVQRATLYRHFPDEPSLFAACSSHFNALNPPPDPTPWTGIEDPDERLRVALGALYGYYERTERMTANILRDVSLVPTIRDAMQPMLTYLDWVRDILLKGRAGARRRKVRAAVGHAMGFDTWRSLEREQGLARADAIDLAVGMVIGAGKR